MPKQSSIAAAKQWLEHDPDPHTRAELAALIEANADELDERFAGPLRFGTAGLRGVLGAGESRMNRVVVYRATYGLGKHLLAKHADAKTRGVVIGYDGRHLSDAFAHEAAAILCALGIKVMLSDKVCPTPLLAYATGYYGAVAGIMVTASHNPPQYNGYKVYAANAAQIIPPDDTAIARHIDAAPSANAINLANLDAAANEGQFISFGDDMDARYLRAIAALDTSSRAAAPPTGRDLSIAYTALHGVGAPLLKQAFAQAGFSNLHMVAAQQHPDGNFPTVNFPNPEEDGAMDLVLALAQQHQSPLVLANDPDADRLAAAVRLSDGSYRQLSGNEVGVLLGHHCLTRAEVSSPLVIASIVSSPWLGVIATELGAAYTSVLTGFKWIATTAMRREAQQGQTFLFGYEEALGYSVGAVVRDKDGISAAVILAALAAALHLKGETLLDELERIARRYGLFVSRQVSRRLEGSEGKRRIASMMQQWRVKPPSEIGGFAVTAVSDCLSDKKKYRDGRVEAVGLPSSDVLIFDLAHGHRAIVRPSGTEPKIKYYLDMRIPLTDDESFAQAEARGAAQVEALARAFSR